MRELVNDTYSCPKSGHIMGKWYPYDKGHHYRQCVVPGCKYKEVEEA